MEMQLLLESRDSESVIYPTSDILNALGYHCSKCPYKKREKVQNWHITHPICFPIIRNQEKSRSVEGRT